MKHVPEGHDNPDGDDDKIYLFFSETAVEYDAYNKLDVSRVARVCKVLLLVTGCSLADITLHRPLVLCFRACCVVLTNFFVQTSDDKTLLAII